MARGDAAKKAWALYRAKYGTKGGGSRSRATSAGAAPRRKRRRFLGVLGKAGVTIMAGAPLVGATAEAIQAATPSTFSGQKPSVGARLMVGFGTWINSLANGFGITPPYKTLHLQDEQGNPMTYTVQPRNTPKNVWWTTTFVGGFMVAVDRAIAMAVKAAVKSPIGGFYLTGR